MANKRRHLGEILYKAGKVEKAALIEAIKETKTTKKRLGQILLERGLVSEDVLHKAIAKQFGLKYVNLDNITVPPDAANLIPADLVRRYAILPLKRENGTLKLAISDPMDLEMMDTVRMQAGVELECYIASPSKIQNFLEEDVEEEDTQEDDDQLKHSIDATAAELEQLGDFQAELLKASSADSNDDGPVVRLVNLVIDNAYYMRASDIHIEPMSDRVRVRYRVDGVCVEKDNIPKSMQAALMTRFKILSGMDIAEKRIPQDGRIKRRIGDQDIDFRVSALPANHGESVVLRILRPDAVNIGIEALGFASDNNEMFERIIKRPNGIFLVTGPTGSGKTTTLYAALQTLNRPDKKILTAEDPVEYNFAGMNQCQVRSDIGLTFDKILRAMLRQAPNIILVGEIRDGEVADIAIQAALTGHLVFSTLHTNDACSAITRLIDMGVKPFLVASSIQAILAQRLIRVICKDCKAEDPNPDAHSLKILKFSADEIKKNKFYKGKLAFREATATELRHAAVAGGMRTLMEDGKLKIFGGVTTPEEVARIAQSEGVVED